ncbi:unnamed protein product, partial [Rodentolepis nana]|uniref:Dynein_C domain-containing protein n=1 Tax=Rodentolepis nana TaxID=102285 RepID=A0A0R3TF59_RODNA
MPDLFGLHDNANITFAQNETYQLLADLLLLQPNTSLSQEGGNSREAIIEEVATQILGQCPQSLDESAIIRKHPIMYEQSMNTVLIQEAIRFNSLLDKIRSTLKELIKAIKGLVVMSAPLEAMATSLFTNQVPEIWNAKAYPSLKALGPWIKDLRERIAFLRAWHEVGIPPVIWISGFFFPQAFLTGQLQNFARKYSVAVDTVSFNFKIMKEDIGVLRQAPKDGCYIHGLYLEGCRWNPDEMCLMESRPKELYIEMPIIWLIPESNRQKVDDGVYDCPVYKTLTRS